VCVCVCMCVCVCGQASCKREIERSLLGTVHDGKEGMHVTTCTA
jgi:hypothetical protein